MKIVTLSFAVALLSTVSAHMDMQDPMPRGHPLNPNAPVKDYDCITAPLEGGCGNKPFPCGGYQPDTAVTQSFNAGQVFNVQFGNPSADPNNPGGNQARHNGGLCEFALSYDDGQSWSRIATYHNTCPDIFYQWPVKIPENAPSCDRCIFSWSWINNLGNREFYQNCADIRIVGSGTAPLPNTGITIANLQGFEIMTPPGDPANTGNAKGSGPTQEDIDANTQGTSVSSPAIDNSGAGNDGEGSEPATTSPAPEPSPEAAPDATPSAAPDAAPDAAPQAAPETTPETVPETVPEPVPAPDSPPAPQSVTEKKNVPPLYTGRCIKKKGKKCVKRAPKCLKREKGKCVKKEGKCIKKRDGKCVRRAPPVCLD